MPNRLTRRILLVLFALVAPLVDRSTGLYGQSDEDTAAPARAKAAPQEVGLTPAQDALLKQVDRYGAQLREFETQGNAKESVAVARKLVDARTKLSGLEHPETATALDRLGSALSRAGDRSAAQPCLEEALRIRRQLFGENHVLTATSLNNLGLLFKAQGKYPQARDYLERSVKAYQEAAGADHPLTATPLTNLGSLLTDVGDLTAARECLERSLKINKAAHGEKDSHVAVSLNNLGHLLAQLGELDAAKAYYLQSLAIRVQVNGEKHPDTAAVLNNLGQLLQTAGDFSGRAYFDQALAIDIEARGEGHPDTVLVLGNLASLLKSQGDYAAARPLYERVLAIRRKTVGEKHPSTASALNNLGSLYSVMNDSAMALLYYRQALAIYRETLGNKHPETGRSLNNLGMALLRRHDFKQAKECFEEALAICRGAYGDRHALTASALNNLGGMYREQKEFPRAQECFEQSWAIRRDLLGEDHPETAASLNNLAGVLHLQGNDIQARALYEQSLQIRLDRLGASHPDTALVLNNLGLTLERLGDWPGAVDREDQARRVVRRHVAQVLPGFAENEQMAYLRNTDEPAFRSALSVGLREREHPEAAERSGTWLINGKGVVQESLAVRALLARETRDPKLAANAKKLLAVRQELASLSVAVPSPERVEQHRTKLQALQAQETFLSRTLFQSSSASTAVDPWIELDALRQRIPGTAVLVNFSRFPLFDLQTDGWNPARYAAWVIPAAGQGEVTLIDLGEAAAIDRAVFAVRKSLAAAAMGSELPGADPALADNLTKLSQLVYMPLAPTIESAQLWLLSPDGPLWLVPWAALPVAEDTYALERHTIRYLISGRELVSDGKRPTSQQSSLALADPDFDAELTGTDSAQSDSSGQTPSVLLAATSRGAELGLSVHWTRLPGTANELAATLPKLEHYLGARPVALKGAAATEAAFKTVVRPRVVVLSTHGFALLEDDDPSLGAAAKGSGKGKAAKDRFNNPLLRCGLVLAGANRASSGDRPAGSDDGILTGLEIVGADLRGTEIVVLSACETGLGELRSGEGVAGLRQAFQLAGARTVVSTLWQIPDQETAWLMTRFWENLADGLDAAEALRDAQLLVLREHRQFQQLATQGDEEGISKLLAARGLKTAKITSPTDRAPLDSTAAKSSQRAHPLLWAAFTLTGPPETAAEVQPTPPAQKPTSTK